MKKRIWLKILLGILIFVAVAVIGFVAYLTVTEYKPADVQSAEWHRIFNEKSTTVEDSLNIYTWNIGYAGLGAGADFFMDGGSGVNPSEEEVAENLEAILAFISENQADAWLLQEVDVHSKRTGYVNELEEIAAVYESSYGLAYNYKCSYVPIPLPTIGQVASGVATFTSKTVSTVPERIALPCPFSWPVSTANLKRCLLVTRLPVEGSDREVVLVNLHLEAYDDGEGKVAQTRMLMDFLQSEYEKGNYVIAGGDFNQTFSWLADSFPVEDGLWTPGIMEEDVLPEGFSYVFDSSTPSCRLLNQAYDENNQVYVLDGFIVSPNVQVERVETVDLGFANSDHNPVKIQITLTQP